MRPTQQPPIQWVPGAIPQEVMLQGREADHSFPLSAEVKNGRAISPLTTCFRGILLHYIIKYRHNFTFTLYICYKNRYWEYLHMIKINGEWRKLHSEDRKNWFRARNKVLFQEITVEKSKAYYGIQRLITTLKRSSNVVLSWARWIQSTFSQHNSFLN
jgi:hypothetical protein